MDDDNLPMQPLQLFWARQMDFSKLRPDEWRDTVADRWNMYLQYYMAFEDARDEVREKRENKAKADKAAAEFHEKHKGATF